MCKKKSCNYDKCIIDSLSAEITDLKSALIGTVIGNEVILFRKNKPTIPIGRIPFVYSESEFLNAFGKPLVE